MGSGETLAFVGGIAAVVVVLLLLFARLRRQRIRRAHGEHDEDLEPVRAEHDVSPVVERLIATPAVGARRMTIPPRAEQPGRMPGPGAMLVAGVELPPGDTTRTVEAALLELSDDGASDDQLWVSREPHRSAAATWKLLASGFPESGMWPLLLPPEPGDEEPWYRRAARRHAGEPVADVSATFRRRIAESLVGSPLASAESLAATSAARGELARSGGKRPDSLATTLSMVDPALLALVPAKRPADVLHALAWPGADAASIPSNELAELVASWELRYGAILVSLTSHSLLFAVLRPPSTEAEAMEALAEQHALCPDEAIGWGAASTGASTLRDAPYWRLSWH